MGGEDECLAGVCSRYVIFAVLTTINVLTYYDRGVIAAVLLDVQNEFNLSSIQSGLLGSCFMVGFMLSSIPFAHYSNIVPPRYLLCLGLCIWCLAAGGSGASQTYWQLVIARSVTGVGEASFCGISPTVIDDLAPPAQRTVWLSIFFAAIPVGAALGYIGAGVITKHTGLDWRWVFYTEALAMLPFAIGILAVPNMATKKGKNIALSANDNDPAVAAAAVAAAAPLPHNNSNNNPNNPNSSLLGSGGGPSLNATGPTRVAHRAGEDSPLLGGNGKDGEDESGRGGEDEESSLWDDLRVVLGNPVYVTTCLAYSSLTFVIGGLAYWLPTVVQKVYHMDLDDATFAIGAITVGCGLVGTGVGGGLVDFVARRSGGAKGMAGTVIQLKWSLIYGILAVPGLAIAFMVSSSRTFFILLATAELFLFAITAPINSGILSSVPEYYRSLAMALSIGIIHLFGDMPSPVIIGVLIHHYSYRTAMLCVAAWFSVCILFLILAFVLARIATRRLLAQRGIVA